jgi:hypothetical protein
LLVFCARNSWFVTPRVLPIPWCLGALVAFRCRTFSLVLSLFLFSACSHPAPHKEHSSATDAAASETPTAVKEKIKIKSPDDKPVVEFDLMSSDPKIEFSANGQAQTVRGKANEKGKRRYEVDGGGLVAEIKADADSIKLRAADGRLLWKIKFVDSKIKISNSEEMANAYVLKPMEADRVKVSRDDIEIGKVNFYRDRGKVKVENPAAAAQYESNTKIFSGAYGVMLMSEIPERERFVIIAELLARGR